MPFRILCADPSEAICRGIQHVGESCGCTIDHYVTTTQDLESSLQATHYDVLLTDSRFGKTDMMDWVWQTRSQLPDLKVILYTGVLNTSVIAQAVAYGFFEVVFKTGSVAKLANCLRALERGRIESSVVKRFREFMVRKDHEWDPPEELSLTRREVQLLVQLSLGLSNKEISAAFNISLETVKEHVQNILRKLEAGDRTRAAVWAIRNRIPSIEILPADLQ
jgi:DNA-binding NarL/FixJ family response regulator